MVDQRRSEGITVGYGRTVCGFYYVPNLIPLVIVYAIYGTVDLVGDWLERLAETREWPSNSVRGVSNSILISTLAG